MLSLDKKLEQWEKTLSKDKLMLITYAIKMETDNLIKNINLNIENCMGAAISDFIDLNIEQIKEIIKRANYYMDDTSKYIKANGVDYMSKIEKVEGEVKEFLRKEMAAGTLKSEAMAKAKKKFDVPAKAKKKFGVPAKDLSNTWLIIKEEDYPKLCSNRGVSIDQSLKINEKRKKEAIERQNKAHTEEKEVKGINSQEKEQNVTEKAREGKKEDIKSSLVEITEVRKFKGQFGEYEKSKDGIKTGEVFIKDVKDIEEKKAEVEEDIKRMIEEFEKTISEKRILALGKLNECMELLSM